MLDENGGTQLADFPPVEEPKWAEWEVAAVINGTPGTSYTEIKMWAMNHTAWPTRVQKDVEVRYYFDVSEVLEKGLSIDDVKVEGKSQQYSAGEQGYATVTGPHLYKGNIYYASIKFEDGRAIMPTGQSEHRDEVQFRISIPDAVNGQSTKGAWDPSNDPSYKGIEDATDLKKADSINENFVMFANGAQVWGVQPDGTKGDSRADLGEIAVPQVSDGPVDKPETTTTTTVTTEPEPTASFRYGDANCDKKVDVSDAVLLARFLAEDNEVEVSTQGKLNADVDASGQPDQPDVTKILKFVARLIDYDALGKK